ncbi:MAG: hypothetical protein HOO86_09285 [Bacteroidales bacterium]|nr:hypothetical protein [Bacteroidales bacterium]
MRTLFFILFSSLFYFSSIGQTGDTEGERVNTTNPVGTLPGNFGVSPAGAATYSIPIDLPPGINGVTPQLALTYNSNGSNGIMGMGWSIAGLSSITRTGTNIYNDGGVDGIDYDDNDKLMLDGNRLIPINTNEYRTKIETFSKIVPYNIINGMPSWFKVYTKGGNIIEYGNTVNSKIEAPGRSDVLTWYMNKITDRKGNFIEFVYSEISGTGNISEVKYGANGTGTPLYIVKFNYLFNRPDPIQYYLYGSSFLSQALLDNIEIKYNNVTIKTYSLSYELNDPYTHLYTHLEKITLWDEGKVGQFNATNLEWGGVTTDTLTIEATSITDINDADITTGDFNGDGKSDIVTAHYTLDENEEKVYDVWSVYYATGNDGISFNKVVIGSMTGWNFSHFVAIDYNSDGLDDIVRVDDTFFYYYKSTGTGFVNAYLVKPCMYIQNHVEFAPSDFNGNGVSELLLIRNEANQNGFHYQIDIYEYNGTTLVSLLEDDILGIDGYHYYSTYNNLKVQPGDFNGDGKSDLLIQTDQNISSVYGLNETNLTLEKIYDGSFNFPNVGNPRFTGDINGDGITDIINVNTATPTTLTIRLFDGKGNANIMNTGISFPNSNMTKQYNDYENYIVSDFNGDGKDDILLIYSYFTRLDSHSEWEFKGIYWDTYYSNGSSLQKESVLKEGPLYFSTFLFDNRYGNCDFNGDGKKDGFVFETGTYNRSWAIFFHKNEESQLIQTITNGLGNVTHIAYDPLTNNTIYTKDSEVLSKVKNIQPAKYVVSSVSKDDGIGGQFMQTYKYEGAKVHLEGKGFLGFKQTISLNPSTGIKNIVSSTINNTYFYSYVQKQKIYSGATLLSQSFYENTVVDFGNKRIFNYTPVSLYNIYSTGDPESEYVKTIRTEKFYNNGDKVYGNLTSLKTYVDEGYRDLTAPTTLYDFYTINNYQYNYYDIADWIISRVSNKNTINKSFDDPLEFSQNYNYIYYPLNDPKQQYPSLQKEFFTPNNANDYLITTSFEYDIFGNIAKRTIEAPNYNDPAVEDRITEYEYSPDYNHRFLTKTITKVNNTDFVQSALYDPKTGLTNSTTDVNGLTTEYSYDSFGRLNRTVLPDGNQIVNELHWSDGHVDNPPFGLFYTMNQASGQEEALTFYDNTGRDHKQVAYTFDGTTKAYMNKVYYGAAETGQGKLKEQTEPYFAGETALKTRFQYLPTGQVKKVIADNAEIEYVYRDLTFVTRNLTTGKSSFTNINAVGNTIAAGDTSGIISYKYNSAGKPIVITNGEGANQSIITMFYNPAGFQDSLVDPDAGLTSYKYNPFGELLSQIDAKGNNYMMKYDVLGRLTEKKLNDPVQITTYTYDGINSLGLPKTITGWNGISSSFTYDQFTRLISKSETIEGNTFTSNYAYDIFGNLKNEIWPSGYANNYEYKNGYLCKVVDGRTNEPLWQLNKMNARGQIKEYLLGNDLTTTKDYDVYGLPVKITTSRNVQNLTYKFDATTGNLNWRRDLNDLATPNDDLYETFTYDTEILNSRLTSWSVYGGQSSAIVYGNNGNIEKKTDVGNQYLYQVNGTTGGPHAVGGIVQPTADYLQNAGQQDIEYTPFNKVSTIKHIDGRTKLSITYGPDETRKISILTKTSNGGINTFYKKKYFIGSNYEVEKDELGRERKLHYLYGGDGLFAIYVIEKDTGIIKYIHKDYQGSYQTITDSKGNVIEELSFDPWGRRRNATDWSFTNMPTSFLFDRGYTGHEHLDEFKLINMNGRVYDPFIARFLSPDPFVQNPSYSQSFNRYSYCVNNPLKFTDPSGYLDRPIFGEGEGHGGGTVIEYTNPYFGPGYKGGMTPVSGNNWVNQYWSESENFERTSRLGFDNRYGEGAWDIGNKLNSNPSTRQDWQSGKISLNEIRRDGGYWITVGVPVDDMYNEVVLDEKGQIVPVNLPAVGLTPIWVSTGSLPGGGFFEGAFDVNNIIDNTISLTTGVVVGVQKISNAVSEKKYEVISKIPILHTVGRLTGALSVAYNLNKFGQDPTQNWWNGVEAMGQIGFWMFGGAQAELIYNLSTMGIDASIEGYNYYKRRR